MLDNDSPESQDSLSNQETLRALYPFYVAYSEARIESHLRLVPPDSPAKEQTMRRIMAPVPFELFPKFLERLGEDRCHYEACWRMGYEASRNYEHDDQLHAVQKLEKIIRKSSVPVGDAGVTQKKRFTWPEDDDGHRAGYRR